MLLAGIKDMSQLAGTQKLATFDTRTRQYGDAQTDLYHVADRRLGHPGTLIHVAFPLLKLDPTPPRAPNMVHNSRGNLHPVT
jgi:hypothetical protein